MRPSLRASSVPPAANNERGAPERARPTRICPRSWGFWNRGCQHSRRSLPARERGRREPQFGEVGAHDPGPERRRVFAVGALDLRFHIDLLQETNPVAGELDLVRRDENCDAGSSTYSDLLAPPERHL